MMGHGGKKVYTERVRQTRTMKMKQMNVSAVAEPQVGRKNNAEPPEDPACLYLRMKAQAQILGFGNYIK